MNSPVRDYLLAQIAELVARYDFPALFLDILFMNPAGQVCYCAWCQERWSEQHHRPLPAAYTPDYLAFITETLGRFQQDVKKIIAASGKSIAITHNFGLPYEYDDYVAFEFNTLGRNFLRGSAIAKIMRAQAAGREVELIGHRFNQDWDFSTKPHAMMRWEAATVLAHNCALMWVDQPHMDGTFDAAALAAMKASYEIVDELQPHIRGSTPFADIALLYPAQSIRLDPEQELDFVGAYKTLSELHWPFDVISEDQLTSEGLASFKLLIIPHARHLLSEAVDAVRDYVQQGGRLLFTHLTATAGLLLPSLAYASFGLVQIGTTMQHPASFLRPDRNHACGNTHLRVTDTLAFEAVHPARTIATHVPPNIDVTWDQWVSHNVAPGQESDHPSVVLGEAGAGQYIYCAPRLFAETIRQGLPAISAFLKTLLLDLYRPAIWVDAPKAVEVTYNRQGDDLVVVLVNGITNRPVRGGVMSLRDVASQDSIDEVIPLHGIQVHIRDRMILGAADRHGDPLTVSYAHAAHSSSVLLDRLDLVEIIRISISDALPDPHELIPYDSR
jgi:hypothetical protein